MQTALVTATSKQGLGATSPIFDGVLIEDVSLPSSKDTQVPHGLGRRWRGFIITSLTLQSIIILAAKQQDPTKFLSLYTNSSTTASFWIF